MAVVPSTGVNEKALQGWASCVGLGEEVKGLVAACVDLNSVLAEADGMEIQNKALISYLRDASHGASYAEDLLSLLEYYRIREQVEDRNDENKLVHDTADENYLHSTLDREIQIRNDDMADAAIVQSSSFNSDDDLPVTAHEIIPYNTKLTVPVLDKDYISCQITKQIDECLTITKHIRAVLQLDNLDYRRKQIYQRTSTDPRETSSCPTKPKVYGRDKERDMILSKLINKSSGENLTVLAVVGNGGVGKTTLAKVVFNNPDVSKHFGILLWVYISVHFNQVKIMRELLESLHGNRYENITELKELQTILSNELKSKRVLLVMDDMWEDRRKEKWDELLAPLLANDVKGNKVLLTTRNPSVARIAGATDDIVTLGGLQEPEFWCLFKEYAFGDSKPRGHKKLQAVGKNIVAKLKGYSLAAKTVGKLLKRKLDYDHWTEILDSNEWKYQQGDDDIMTALKISYNYLSKHLQKCFSYCALFPKNHWYDEERLVNIWIAQGFISCTDQHTRAEEIGSKYLADLIDWGFFLNEPPRISLLMHDLIHDLALLVSSQDCFTIEDVEPGPPSELVRHVSVITESVYYGQPDGTIQPNDFFLQSFTKISQTLQKRKLSTLMLFGAHDASFVSTFQQGLSEGRVVRVLKMEIVNPDLSTLISNISAFINLRYLELRSFYNVNNLILTEGISSLYHLQVLDISHNCGAKTVLPRDFNNLINLRHFIANEELHAQIAGVGKLTSLQELKAFHVRKDSEFSISQLGKMNELRGSISICSLENLDAKEDAIEARLRDKLYLTSLRLSWYPMLKSSSPILECLEPPEGIEALQVDGYKGSAPSWMGSNMYLTSLRSLRLENCKKWLTLPPFQHLPLLQELHLITMPHIHEIQIGRLRVLELRGMPRLIQCILMERDQSCLNLEVLEIEQCPNLKILLFHLSSPGTLTEHQFPCLRRLHIRNCHRQTSLPPLPLGDTTIDTEILMTSSKYKLFQLQTAPKGRSCLAIQGDQYVQTLDGTVLRFSKLKDLHELEIRDYPDLTCLTWEGMQHMSTLKRLEISFCPNLFSNDRNIFLPASIEELKFQTCNITGKKLSKMMLNMQFLRIFELHSCKGIHALSVGGILDDHNQAAEGSLHIPQCCLRTSETLYISFSSMVFLSKNGFEGFKALKKMNIKDCYMLLSSMVLEGESEAPCCSILPSSLLKLKITGLEDIHLQCSDLPSLSELHICRSPHLTCLEVGCCTAVQNLHVEECCQLESIQGLDSLAFLNVLIIETCPKLGSVQLQSCTSLQILHIGGCEALCTLDFSHSLNSLKEVAICRNRSLASLKLHFCTALEKLCIRDCPGLKSCVGFKSFIALKHLEISMCPGFVPSWESAENDIEEDHEFSIPLEHLDIDDLDVLSMPLCSQLTSLKVLTLHGVHSYKLPSDKVDILMENHEAALSNLTSLEELAFCSFKHLCSLPSKLHCLGSLNTLKLHYCRGITSLPKEGLPPSLIELDLYECSEELNKLCKHISKDKVYDSSVYLL
ncbi:putative disease resistance protein RGA1 [Dichanthelium oligosanthes]|uniref:Putative disease resistance protein RGA1 n=1 Tax=Dichanthelium oligosanthes TaxID=888268 RepID=A0A1E5W1D6_9POAL|nr:putative disease resistance protein RGA1 [Dichanthelium oligosanthes]